MVFSSVSFVFIFLPIVTILYFLAKDSYRNYILLIASLLFYSVGEPKFIFIFIGSIIFNYIAALCINKQRANLNISRIILIADIFINISLLFIYKYLLFSTKVINSLFKTDFVISNIALPIGISFFTFQALSYVVDVYRKRVEVQKNVISLALYISFFPQLIAGPIVRYSSIEKQLSNRKTTLEGLSIGCKRFMIGFSKKILLANNLSIISEAAFKLNPKEATPAFLWLGALCYSLQIFYDFSGYSDMAIGLGRIFGFTFDENFNYPYISKSITEFWRRWHISLGQWFRDYVYIPLGGSRVSVPRHVINMLIVWLLTGIWHGANYTFIFWGLEFFVLLVIEKYIVKPEQRHNILIKTIWQLFSLLMIVFGWVIFNSPDLLYGIRYCCAMIGKYGFDVNINVKTFYYIKEYGFFIIFGALFSTPIMKRLEDTIHRHKYAYAYDILASIGVCILFLWSVSFIILGANNPFIYFNF